MLIGNEFLQLCMGDKDMDGNPREIIRLLAAELWAVRTVLITRDVSLERIYEKLNQLEKTLEGMLQKHVSL